MTEHRYTRSRFPLTSERCEKLDNWMLDARGLLALAWEGAEVLHAFAREGGDASAMKEMALHVNTGLGLLRDTLKQMGDMLNDIAGDYYDSAFPRTASRFEDMIEVVEIKAKAPAVGPPGDGRS